MRLTREVRLMLTGRTVFEDEPRNGWAGVPGSGMVVPHVTIRCTVAGPIDSATGYLCDIRQIDEAVRCAALNYFDEKRIGSGVSGARAVTALYRAVAEALGDSMEVIGLEMGTSPFLQFEARMNEQLEVLMTESFEFSASHRLHCSALSDAENARVFGKCSNPNGHGHNYVVDVTVKGQPDSGTGVLLPIEELERIVKSRVLDRFDHKHLNVDCEEFRHVNPSIENIARTIWRLLDGAFDTCVLHRVRAWETAKTYAECFGAIGS